MNTDEFYTLVRSMREAQKQYFKTRCRDTLIESKRLEAAADKEIKRYFEQQTAEVWDKRTGGIDEIVKVLNDILENLNDCRKAIEKITGVK